MKNFSKQLSKAMGGLSVNGKVLKLLMKLKANRNFVEGKLNGGE